jgi:aryl-alcohol dehydrogenase-like predicted oxidoreductase
MRKALENSLRRLGTDHIDLYQLHNPRLDAIQNDALWTELDRAQSEGLIGAVGVALGPAIDMREIEEAVVAIEQRGATPQIIYNLLEQDLGRGVFPTARKHDASILVRVPHSSGLLDGTVRSETEFAPGDHRNWRVTTNEKRRLWLEDGLRKVERLDPLLNPLSVNGVGAGGGVRTIGQLALQFILHEPTVASILPNTYDAAGLDDFTAYDAAPALTDAEYDHIQALYNRNFDLEAAPA